MTHPGQVLIVQEAGWAPGSVWAGAENLAPTNIRSLYHPACSQSLYRPSYPAHFILCARTVNYCGTVRPNRKVTLKSTGKKFKLKWVDTENTCVTELSKTKCKHNEKTAFHQQSVISMVSKTSLKPAVVQDYNRHFG